MWPASALLTGNGVAFILRVPGTEHGDWWSMNGWWIFAGTAAVSLLSKYLIRFARPATSSTRRTSGSCSCFLVLGPATRRAARLLVGPDVAWLAAGDRDHRRRRLRDPARLRLLEIAVAFWLAFAAGIAVLAASGHA